MARHKRPKPLGRNTTSAEVEAERQQTPAERSYELAYAKAAKEAARAQGRADGTAAAMGDAPAAAEATPPQASPARRANGMESPEPGFINTTDSEGQRWMVSEDGYKSDSGKAEIQRAAEIEEAESIMGLGLKAFEFSQNRADSLTEMLLERDQTIAGQQQQIDELRAMVLELKAEKVEQGVANARELAEAEGRISQQVTNAGSVGSNLEISSNQAALRHEQNMQLLESTTQRLAQPIEQLQGSLKSASAIYQEGIAASQDQLAATDAKATSLDLRLQELEGRAEVLARADNAVGQTAAVAREASSQLLDYFYGNPAMADVRAWFGINVASLNNALNGVAALQANGALDPAEAAEIQASLEAQRDAVLRAQQRDFMPGANPRTGDPITREVPA